MGKGGRKNRRRADFHYRVDDEPHAKRRTEILKKYPEVKKLYGFEPLTKYIAGATVFMQLALAIGTRHLGWAKWLGVIYCVGATANHSLFLAIHELAHNLFFKKNLHNRIFSMFANLPIAIPCAPPAPHTWPASRAERTAAALAEPLTRARHASGG